MKKLFLGLLIIVSFLGFSQKVKLKKNDVLVDDVVWLKYDGCGAIERTCSLLNTNNEELIFIKWIELKGVEPITNYNKTGDVVYEEIKFLGYNQSFEIQKTQKSIIELLYNSKVINTDGTLNQDKAAILIEKYGHEFSEKYNKANNNTIIINNNQQPQRSGLNINLGR